MPVGARNGRKATVKIWQNPLLRYLSMIQKKHFQTWSEIRFGIKPVPSTFFRGADSTQRFWWNPVENSQIWGGKKRNSTKSRLLHILPIQSFQDQTKISIKPSSVLFSINNKCRLQHANCKIPVRIQPEFHAHIPKKDGIKTKIAKLWFSDNLCSLVWKVNILIVMYKMLLLCWLRFFKCIATRFPHCLKEKFYTAIR